MVIDAELARLLVTRQFPQWADLPITEVSRQGWDNRTFRLGTELSVRLPTGDWYALQVEKEHRWLPVLAGQLPLPIPTPVARGLPDLNYPYPWSIYRWIEGVPAADAVIADETAFAVAVAEFLVALQAADATGGPEPGPHNFFRGGPLTTYAAETEAALAEVGDAVPVEQARAVWTDALAATWTGEPVWLHGDVAVGNLLVRDGRLAAVIDFGTSGVGDPACDVVIGLNRFSGSSRTAFRATLGVDDATWARARGWALWKALITLDDPATAAEARHAIDAVLADHASSSAR
ncbi:MAG TPA: aminoglycoside phosphotransferase family protein [Propionibacteriaceae bacterium]|nr:aminoglycoside phosphotransferase family protein [Propionibacteriaceae bacterium]